MATYCLQNHKNIDKINTFTSSTKGAPPFPLGWRTGGCQPWLFFFVFSSLINGVLAIENIQIFGGAFGGAIFSCVVFYISLCLYNKYYDKLFTNDDNKKEAKMEEGKQLQKILIKQEETTEEEQPSTIEIDFTQASELDNGVDKQEIIEKKDVLVKNFDKNVLLKRSKSVTNLSIAGGSLKRCCSCREINMEMDNKSVCSSIDWESDFDDCVGGVYPIGGETCIECHIQPNGKTGLTPDEKMDLASHEAGHAFVAFLLGVPITLLPEGQLLGHTLVKFGDKQVISKEEKEKQITCLWGGRESEKKLRGKITTMFKSDQRAIKEVLEPMGPEFGLSDNDALYVFKAESEKFKGMKDDDKYLIGNNCKLKARQLIEQNAAAVEALASTLFGCEEMVGEQQIKETLIKLQQQYTGNK
ncbi:unnamed protein product [Meloidogyne enterolobii]|uniref:Uncharacterized protein n=1 Tax=Meloidogyne enterolobii TaxID=390850 RepID=A0ACB0YT00_MELEN